MRSPKKIAKARELRNASTQFEIRLWSKLNNRQMSGWRFRRQHPLGPYILDFYCPEIRLAVELDGEQHGRPGEAAHDAERTAFLTARGVHVLRFWNNDIKENLRGVLETIHHHTEQSARRLGVAAEPARRPREQSRPPTRRQIAALNSGQEKIDPPSALYLPPSPPTGARGGRGGPRRESRTRAVIRLRPRLSQ